MLKSSSTPVALGLFLGAALGAVVAWGLGASSAEAVPERPTSDIMPLDQVKPGMKGYGLTVFRGTTPEKFDVEIIATLKNFRPNQDLILIKTPNHPRLDAARTVAGMSGSPIYIDGKMIGAYAYGWTFGAEPIAGVTPIERMLEDAKRPIPAQIIPRGRSPIAKTPRADAASPRSDVRSAHLFRGDPMKYDLGEHAKQVEARVAAARGTGSGVTSALTPATTPMLVGGASPGAMALATKLLGPMGMEPLQAGGGGSASPGPDAPTAFVDGGAIGVQLLRGDVSMMGLGTVTRVMGDKLVAFGHPMMGGGLSEFPTSIARVHWILASTNRSFKIGEPVRSMGALVNDRQASIVVDSKRVAPTFPIHVKIEGAPGAPKTDWNMIAAHDPFMAPMIAAMGIGSALETTAAERNEMTWRATSKLQIAGFGTLTFEDFGAGSGDPIGPDSLMRSRLTRALGALMSNPWENVTIEKIDVTVKITQEREVSLLRGTEAVELEIDPGQPARIKLSIVPYQGKPETRVIEVPIPASYAGDEVDIEIEPGFEADRPVPSPESVSDLIAGLGAQNFPAETLVSTIKLRGEAGAAFHGKMTKRLPPGAIDALRSNSSSVAPETFAAEQKTVHPMQRFVVGRDRVRVKVRPNLR
jgi:hypothetical protein